MCTVFHITNNLATDMLLTTCRLFLAVLWLPCIICAQEVDCTEEISVCPGPFPVNHSCPNLNEVLSSIESNTTLILQPGVHVIKSYFRVSNKTDLRIVGNPTNSSSVLIECDDSYGLIFMHIQRLTISGLTVHDCGFKGIEHIKNLFSFVLEYIDLFYEPLSDFSTGVFMVLVSDLKLENVAFDRNEGFGLVGINVIGASKFTNVSFTFNRPSECVLNLTDITQPGGSGGAMFLLYQDFIETTYKDLNTSLLIENALVESNYNCRPDQFTVQHDLLSRSLEPVLTQYYTFIGAGGITITLAQNSFAVIANITDSIFRYNSGSYHGSALEVAQFEQVSDSHVFVTDTTFIDNGDTEINRVTTSDPTPAGALVTTFYLAIPPNHLRIEALGTIVTSLENSVYVINCNFRRNIAVSGSGIQVFSFGPTVSGIQDRITIQNCTFEENVGEYGSAIFITEISYSAFEPGVKVTIDSIKVINNRKLTTSPATSFQTDATGVVDINFINITLSGTNMFESNEYTAISVYSGILVVTGFTNITNNTAINGGGLILDTESYLVLSGERADMLFKENRALVNGGGIYVNFNTIRTNDEAYDCFLFFDNVDIFCDIYRRCSMPSGRFSLSFINNSATYGRVIYGSTLLTCPWSDSMKGRKFLSLNQSISDVDDSTLPIFLDPFSDKFVATTINTAASNIKVNHIVDSENTPRLHENNTIYVYPGQEFLISLSTLDRLEQPVPLTLFSQLQASPDVETYSSIGESNRFFLARGTDNIPFQVFAKENTSYRVVIASNEALVTFTIQAVLESCPVGFSFNDTTNDCKCNIPKASKGLRCNNDGTIRHRPGYWVGITKQLNYVQAKCGPDYCITDSTVLNLSEPDSQCDNHHSRVLCGGCSERYSRMIGTRACGVCDSYWHLLFILLFAALGIVLFAYLALFNITITDGLLNGFVFYSNIMLVYRNLYIPSNSADYHVVPSIVIYFLSLNFGIPICFYPNMTDLHLAIWRFVFPTYLILILSLVALCGKCVTNQRLAKFFQKINVTHVFATLILISFTSLVQACFGILTFTNIEGFGTPLRWQADPNVPYNDPLHIALVVFSVLLLLILTPIPLLLIFPGFVLRTPVLISLKPLVDAFIAPLAPKREFWVGLRMLFRQVFFLFSIVLRADNEANLIVQSVLIAVLTVVEFRLRPFTGRIRNYIDLILMVSLTLVFSVTTIAAVSTSDEKAIGFTFFNLYVFVIMFALLNVYYILTCFKRTRDLCTKVTAFFKDKWTQMLAKIPTINTKRKARKTKKSVFVKVEPTTHTTSTVEFNNFQQVEFIAFREELLETEAEQVTES